MTFEDGVRYHLDNGPSTWTVRKAADRVWQVVNGAGDVVDRATTKTRAAEMLTSGTYFRIWHERDQWYRGTSRDHRNREFTESERSIIDRLLAERAVGAE